MKAVSARRRTVLSLMLLTLPYLIGKAEVQCLQTVGQLCTGKPYANNKEELPNAWRGITPLHSTREEVERLLGKHQRTIGAKSIYESKRETVDILYSKGPCELSGVELWNVAKDVVIWLKVIPATKLFVKDLKLDPTRYVRQRESHPENWVEYRNLEDGVRVNTILDGKEEFVLWFTYEPRKKDNYLRCLKSRRYS